MANSRHKTMVPRDTDSTTALCHGSMGHHQQTSTLLAMYKGFLTQTR